MIARPTLYLMTMDTTVKCLAQGNSSEAESGLCKDQTYSLQIADPTPSSLSNVVQSFIHIHLYSVFIYILTLPNDKVLDWSKLKDFADDKIKLMEKLKFCWGRAENIVGKGENAGYQHFLLFPQCFQKASFTVSLKVRIVW